MQNQKYLKKKLKNKESLNNYAKYTSIGFQMIVIILAGVFGGIKTDKWLNTNKPVFTAIFSLLAVVLAIYYVIKDLIKQK